MELFSQNFVNATEQVSPLKAKITGTIPEWLDGDLLRVGPGKFDMNGFTCNHWFDGMAMMYKFSIKSNEATFSLRYLQSDAYNKFCKHGKPIFTEFGTRAYPDPSKSLFSRMLSTFDATAVTDNGAINIMNIDNEIFVSSETCYMRRIDAKNLDTKEKIDMNKTAGINFACAHVLTDVDGTSYNIGLSVLSGPKYVILKRTKDQNSKGKDVWNNTKALAVIPSSWKASYSYIHSFSLTENYIIFLEQPMIINTFKLATCQVKGRSLIECIEWHPQEMVRFHIVNKHTGEQLKTKYMTNEAFFVLHHVNAYERKGQIVMDMIAYPNPDILDKLFLEKVRANQYDDNCIPELKRVVLPIIENIQDIEEHKELVNIENCLSSAKRVSDNQKGDRILISGVSLGTPGFDMPSVSPIVRSKYHRYVYGNGGYEQGYYKNSVCKIDVESGTTKLWRETQYQYPSEPVYVQRPNSTEEDDGVLLVPLCDTRPDIPNSMVIIDAKTFEEIARIEIPVAIPNGLHGIFVPRKS